MIGEQGKTWLQTEAERTNGLIETNQQGLETVQALAQDAQGLTVTQDVMKNQAAMNSALAAIAVNNTRLTADNHTALLQLQQLNGMMAQLTANASEGIDEANRRARVERQMELGGITRTELYIPGLFGVGTDSRDRRDRS